MTHEEQALKLCQKFGILGSKWEQTNYYTLDLENAKQCALISLQRENETLKKLYAEVTKLEFEIDRDAWVKWRVSLENAGIENEQLQTAIQKL